MKNCPFRCRTSPLNSPRQLLSKSFQVVTAGSSTMAGTKRQYEEVFPTRAKKTKDQKPSQQARRTQSVKSPKIQRPALPSPHDSSAASEDAAESLSGKDSSDAESRETPSKPNIQPAKTPTTARAGVLLNGNYLRQKSKPRKR